MTNTPISAVYCFKPSLKYRCRWMCLRDTRWRWPAERTVKWLFFIGHEKIKKNHPIVFALTYFIIFSVTLRPNTRLHYTLITMLLISSLRWWNQVGRPLDGAGTKISFDVIAVQQKSVCYNIMFGCVFLCVRMDRSQPANQMNYSRIYFMFWNVKSYKWYRTSNTYLIGIKYVILVI